MKINFMFRLKQNKKQQKNFIVILFAFFLLWASVFPARAMQNTSTGGRGSGTENPQSTGSPAAQQPIVTQLTSSGRTVKLTVNVIKDSRITSGRIKIHYPQEFLNLADAQTGKFWEVEDVNRELSEGGRNVVSLAWAGTEKLTREGGLLTVTWEALDMANGREIVVETEIVELYSEKERLDVKSDWIIDRIRPGFPLSTPNAANGASAVRTGDNSNAAGLGLLCLSSALLMARMLYRKLKY